MTAPKVPADFFYRMHGLHQDWLLHHNSSAQVSAPQVTLLDIEPLNLNTSQSAMLMQVLVINADEDISVLTHTYSNLAKMIVDMIPE